MAVASAAAPDCARTRLARRRAPGGHSRFWILECAIRPKWGCRRFAAGCVVLSRITAIAYVDVAGGPGLRLACPGSERTQPAGLERRAGQSRLGVRAAASTAVSRGTDAGRRRRMSGNGGARRMARLSPGVACGACGFLG